MKKLELPSSPPNPNLIKDENVLKARHIERTRLLKKAFKRAKRGISTRIRQ